VRAALSCPATAHADLVHETCSIVKALFRKLHTLFTESMSNPFYKPGQPISSKKLDADLGMHASEGGVGGGGKGDV